LKRAWTWRLFFTFFLKRVIFDRYNKRRYIEESEIDFNDLVHHLKKRNASKIIWIAENATRITGKIEYDSWSNKVLGFVLSLKNGLPD